VNLLSIVSNSKHVYSEKINGKVDGTKVYNFLVNLKKKLKRTTKRNPYYIFMDNASIHKTRQVMKFFEKTTWIIPIFNAPYCPEYNPIENVFSVVKRYFRNYNKINQDYEFTTKLIDEAILQVTRETYHNCFEKCFRKFIDAG